MTEPNLYNVGYDVGFEDGFKEAQPNPALKAAQERTKGMLTEARMSNDLAKRLRETTYMHQVDCELKMKCADRIEELEAKLAKAVEALQWLKVEIRGHGFSDEGRMLTMCISNLAELTGGKDE